MANVIRWESDAMLSVAQKLDALSRELASCRSTVARIAAGMERESGSMLQVNCSVTLSRAGMRLGRNSAKDGLRRCSDALSRYGDLAARSAGNVRAAWQSIEDMEHELSGGSGGEGTDSPHGGSAGGQNGGVPADRAAAAERVNNFAFPSWESLVRKIIGKFGPIGSVYSSILGQDGSLASYSDFYLRMMDLAIKWNLADVHDGKFWMEMIGHKAVETTGSFFGDVGSSFMSTMAKPMKWVTTIVKTGFDNFEEHGAERFDRCLVEWHYEVAATMVIDAGVSALITGGIILMGGTPVGWVVGLGTAAVTTVVDVLWSGTAGDGKTLVQSIGTWVGDRYDDAKEVVVEAWDTVTETIDEAWDTATETAGEIWDTATEKVGEVLDTATEKAEEIWDTATEKVGEVLDTAAEKAEEAWDNVKETASDAKEWVDEKVEGFKDGLNAVANWMFG